MDERGIEPHVRLIDKAERTDGTFSRSDFAFDPESNLYVCPGGKELRKYHRAFAKPRDGLTKDGTMIYFARKQDCEACALKPKCCPNVPARKIARSVMRTLWRQVLDSHHWGRRADCPAPAAAIRLPPPPRLDPGAGASFTISAARSCCLRDV